MSHIRYTIDVIHAASYIYYLYLGKMSNISLPFYTIAFFDWINYNNIK